MSTKGNLHILETFVPKTVSSDEVKVETYSDGSALLIQKDGKVTNRVYIDPEQLEMVTRALARRYADFMA